MSGLRRRVRRKADERALSGYKGGKRLSDVVPRIGNESYHVQARRYVRTFKQMQQLRAKLDGHRAPPPGLTTEAPVEVKPGAGTL